MAASHENHLLAALPPDALTRWHPDLEAVDMPLGEVLYESGGTLAHVYFPTTAIVSLLYVLEDGASAEIAVVGNEGGAVIEGRAAERIEELVAPGEVDGRLGRGPARHRVSGKAEDNGLQQPRFVVRLADGDRRHGAFSHRTAKGL